MDIQFKTHIVPTPVKTKPAVNLEQTKTDAGTTVTATGAQINVRKARRFELREKERRGTRTRA